MIYNQDITLDLNTNTSYVVVGAKQGDDRSRTITATILQNGESVVFADNDTASYRIRKPNGQANWGIATINRETNQVIIELDATDLAVPGRCQTDVLIKSGTELLGTANFIIDVQTAPNIAEDAVKSEAFEQLSQMVRDANSIIERAQAWTEGKRGSKEVLGDSWSISTSGSGNFEVTLDFDTFKEEIYPSAINEVQDYRFIYVINANEEYWRYEYEREEEKISDMSKYGIEITGTPSHNDQIIITASFADPTWHNNAKWYVETLKNVGIGTVTTAEPGFPAQAESLYNEEDGKYNFNFTIPSVHPHAAITVNQIAADQEASGTVSIEDYNGQVEIEEDEDINLQKIFHFTLNIPEGKQGEKGENAGFANDMTAHAIPLPTGDNATVEVTQYPDTPNTAKRFHFEFGLPKGDKGDKGDVPTFTIDNVTTISKTDEEYSGANVTLVTEGNNVKFSFVIPEGTDGQGQVNSVMGITPGNENTQVNDQYDVKKEKIFDLIYPIKSIYITTDIEFDPQIAFGGTWRRIEGYYLYAANTTGTNYRTIGAETNITGNIEGTINTNNLYANFGFYKDPTSTTRVPGIGANMKSVNNIQANIDHYLLSRWPDENAIWQQTFFSEGTQGTINNLVSLIGEATVGLYPLAKAVYVWERTGLSTDSLSN